MGTNHSVSTQTSRRAGGRLAAVPASSVVVLGVVIVLVLLILLNGLGGLLAGLLRRRGATAVLALLVLVLGLGRGSLLVVGLLLGVAQRLPAAADLLDDLGLLQVGLVLLDLRGAGRESPTAKRRDRLGGGETRRSSKDSGRSRTSARMEPA